MPIRKTISINFTEIFFIPMKNDVLLNVKFDQYRDKYYFYVKSDFVYIIT